MGEIEDRCYATECRDAAYHTQLSRRRITQAESPQQDIAQQQQQFGGEPRLVNWIEGAIPGQRYTTEQQQCIHNVGQTPDAAELQYMRPVQHCPDPQTKAADRQQR